LLLARNPQGIRPLGMSVCKWEHVVKVDFKEVCCEGVDWIDLALERGMRWAIVNRSVNRGAL